ncbi:MAG: hypothetical protein KHW96_08560, partial [Firmicutes bacterium]|nr:hypothetical protein [Bacillota bacterium]
PPSFVAHFHVLPSGAFVRSLFNLQDTRPLLRNIAIILCKAKFVNRFFSSFPKNFYQSFGTLMEAPMKTALQNSLFRLPEETPFVNT